MVTEANGGAAGTDDLLPLGEIAQLRGLSPSQITNRVKAWTAAGAITSVKRGRQRLIRLADFDRLVAESAGNWQLAGWRTRRSMALDGDGESLTALQKRKAAAESELRLLEIAKRRGALVPLAGPQGVETAAARLAEQCSVRSTWCPVTPTTWRARRSQVELRPFVSPSKK